MCLNIFIVTKSECDSLGKNMELERMNKIQNGFFVGWGGDKHVRAGKYKYRYKRRRKKNL